MTRQRQRGSGSLFVCEVVSRLGHNAHRRRTTACASGKVFAKQKNVGYTHNMQVLHTDNRKRVTLPAPARPKDSWIPEVIGPNQIVLTRVEKPARPRAKLVRKSGQLLLSSKRPISWEETRKAMDEFP